MSRTERTALLIGDDMTDRLAASGVILFGCGGVGSYAAEALARAGVGRIRVVDGDTVDESNINRQLIALTSTVGMKKADVQCARISDINPDCDVQGISEFFLPENAEFFCLPEYDYVIDCIDMVTAKIEIIRRCVNSGTRVISCMGTGNKLSPVGFEIADISRTSVCPLARVMRRELKKYGICSGVNVVYSKEQPRRVTHPPASISYVPGTAGLLIASKVIGDLLGL